MFRKKHNFEAFTIMEMIVATAIFSIIMTMYLGIFISTFRANGKMVAKQKVQNEVRYIIDVMSKEIRLGTINYDYYSSAVSNPELVLALKDVSENHVYFDNNNGILRIKYDENDTWHELSTSNIYIEDLKFYISPINNPFSQAESVKAQPLVTLFMKIKYNDESSNDGIMIIQTSISSRQYKE
ncbi:MAG: prepilin-type N-terminal cleavage/methylation domain-containing protein [Patescibacteria group bacterium]|nr:prepilin-type N-terminal cleavage/methylation domain-containing protein [Patescibacteria group bacterium]MDD4304543.1 prepilin-type N-terminal cleavage/methylation domain-containing protein [Patescibacteria group bacterium]MDD4695651.1 prepilin-type N-terminal cleavage/methylation domain-containing protein [Patescibacteria group bacterium]